MKREVHIISYETGKPIHVIDVSDKPDDAANRIVRGMDINLDHARFYVKVVSTPTTKIDLGSRENVAASVVAGRKPKARKCKGCKKSNGCDSPVAIGELKGYWHYKCLLAARAKQRAASMPSKPRAKKNTFA